MAAEQSVEFLDLDDLLDLARLLLGDPPPTRDVGLLASAVARPQTHADAEIEPSSVSTTVPKTKNTRKFED